MLLGPWNFFDISWVFEITVCEVSGVFKIIYVEKTAGPAANFDICGVFEISHVRDIDIYLYVDICHCYKCCWSIDICQRLSQGSNAVDLFIIYTDLFNYFLDNSKLMSPKMTIISQGKADGNSCSPGEQ